MSNLFLLQNSQIIDLFEIKLNDFEGYFYFHGSKNLNRDIVFKGVTYLYIPCELSNLEYNSDGKQGRPTFTISNVNNFITNFIKDRSDLLGKRIYIKKIYSKDLDGENFGGATKNILGTKSFKDFINIETFIINKKNTENKERVEFSLCNVLDVEGMTTPTRKVYSDFCTWDYRGEGCNYGKNSNYSGPKIDIAELPYAELSQVIDDYPSIESNLLVWLKPGGHVFGPIITRSNSAGTRLIEGRKISNWTNEADDINTGGGSFPSVIISTDTAYTKAPLEYINNGRAGNQTGAFFSSSDSNNLSTLKINHAFGADTNYTLFFVYEHVNKISGRRDKVLASDRSTGDWVIGSDRGFYNASFFQGKRYTNPGNATQVVNIYDQLLAYSIVSSTTLPANYQLYGSVIKNTIFSTNYFYSLGLNLHVGTFGGDYVDDSSEFVFYELIIFDAALNDQQIAAVNTYLSSKYRTPINEASLGTVSLEGSTFFDGYEDGNLGVPMSDENDKLFLDSFLNSNFESYNLNNLSYKGDYNEETQYSKGDFVKIDPEINFDFNESSIISYSEISSRFFVCIGENGAKNLHPLDFTDIWVEDKCSKTLNGCFLRFRGDIPIPFGGFPGTVTYEYKLPNS